MPKQEENIASFQVKELPDVATKPDAELDMDDVVIIFKMARLSTKYHPQFILPRKWAQAFIRVRSFLKANNQIPS